MAKNCRVCVETVAGLGMMDATEFRQVMDDLDASLDAMAALLGVARRQVASYRKDKPIPPHIALAVRQIRSLAA